MSRNSIHPHDDSRSTENFTMDMDTPVPDNASPDPRADSAEQRVVSQGEGPPAQTGEAPPRPAYTREVTDGGTYESYEMGAPTKINVVHPKQQGYQNQGYQQTEGQHEIGHPQTVVGHPQARQQAQHPQVSNQGHPQAGQPQQTQIGYQQGQPQAHQQGGHPQAYQQGGHPQAYQQGGHPQAYQQGVPYTGSHGYPQPQPQEEAPLVLPPTPPPEDEEADDENDVYGKVCGFVCILIAFLLPCLFCSICKIMSEFERGVKFRFGKLIRGELRPGLHIVVPCVDEVTKVDMRTRVIDVPPQKILTADSLALFVDAVLYYRISDATRTSTVVENLDHSISLHSQTALRQVLGTMTLQEILNDKYRVAADIREPLDKAGKAWGVIFEKVEMKNVSLPPDLQRSMAQEAEATREARAKLIAAEGEQKASKALKEAADVINQSPGAIQLRYLQSLQVTAHENNRTIIMPLPQDLMRKAIEKMRSYTK